MSKTACPQAGFPRSVFLSSSWVDLWTVSPDMVGNGNTWAERRHFFAPSLLSSRRPQLIKKKSWSNVCNPDSDDAQSVIRSGPRSPFPLFE